MKLEGFDVKLFARWRSTSGVLAIATAVVLAMTCGVKPPPPDSKLGSANLDFVLKDMNGQTIRLADFKGRPMIINFWATWCGPCRAEMPEFVQLAEQYRSKNLVVLGVSVDDKPDAIKKFAEEYHLNYPQLVGLDQEKFQQTYDAIEAVPVTWFIRADGAVQAIQKGPPASKDWFHEQAKVLMAASGDRP